MHHGEKKSELRGGSVKKLYIRNPFPQQMILEFYSSNKEERPKIMLFIRWNLCDLGIKTGV